MNAPRLSILICTRDRAEMLPGCFDALAAQPFDSAPAEVIVVNNGSRDRTAEVVRAEAARGRLPLRVVDEAAPGLSIARNTGVERAQGDFVIFLDDDALAAPGWLAAFDRAAAEHPVVQGRILVRLECPQPPWMTEADLAYLSQLDQGESAGPLVGSLFGANFGVQRKLFDRIGAFRTDLGAGKVGFGEDTDFGLRAVAAGFRPFYAPDALAYHRIPAARATRRAFLRRCYQSGLSQPLFQTYAESSPRLVLGFARAALVQTARAVFTLDPARRMDQLATLWEHGGRVRQILRLRGRRSRAQE